ncbi:PA2169 family four-helix-bundle protein [Chryseobacterium fluminis]|uniref:PA2169 family four-helix-bundle protein n=1 Tax=Chryseobacterium fluminis TaxID=2983606 RepID=UPI00225A23E4|nr:PA2169 family four-helix-bundle protein [Chryseobacterium sp. MMS21-Ot14]UZT98675.1 PA2169 family four-helix-bundle protein [Chryseobacterium sp. MMS21-Ot14]
MKTTETVAVLNDLLQITNDRIEGFGKVEGKIWEMYPDIKDEYDRMISQSKIMKNELIDLINEKGGTPQDSPSVAGALHRTWIDIKNSFTMGNREESTLGNVVFGEQAAIDAYQNALDSGDLCEKSTKIVAEQLHQLNISYNQFKKIEDYKSK